ncbi:MAG: transketolase [Planctomycetota bacterium]
MPDIEPKLAVDTIRMLSADAVLEANSGHTGTPVALAPVAYEIFQNHLRYDPADPKWANRDRFILSVGHASMLLYSMLHVCGVKEKDGSPAVSLDDIKHFRQLGYKTPGHPESHLTAGVEVTTGPLGQGVGTSVGIAAAGKHLAAKYPDLFDYNVYVLCSDGDMMEGIGNEAASLAGHMQLDNLVWLYDDNEITIEGDTDLAFTENVADRMAAQGWNVIHIDDANDIAAVKAALENFKNTTGKPTFVNIKSKIAYGFPTMQGSHNAHAAVTDAEEIKGAKKHFGLPPDEKFYIPDGTYDHYAAGFGKRGSEAHAAWKKKLDAHADGKAIADLLDGKLPAGWDADLPTFEPDAKGMASRSSSGKVLNALAKKIPTLLGGSADLAPSNNTLLADEDGFLPGTYHGRNFHYGVREHVAMTTVNGLTLSGLRGYGATFFVFTDYCRPALRLASIMQIPSLFIFTHDSIGLGEDGPTHQPIEHLAMMRATPGVYVFRPADANEVRECYKAAMKLEHNPALMVFSRQNLPTMDADTSDAAKGAYVIGPCQGTPDVILMGTGSEVQHLMEAKATLEADGMNVRVVSMPCWELFEQQDDAYKQSVLPDEVTKRVAMEAASDFGWHRYIGPKGKAIAMQSFGESAPAGELFKHFGFTAENVVKTVKSLG